MCDRDLSFHPDLGIKAGADVARMQVRPRHAHMPAAMAYIRMHNTTMRQAHARFRTPQPQAPIAIAAAWLCPHGRAFPQPQAASAVRTIHLGCTIHLGYANANAHPHAGSDDRDKNITEQAQNDPGRRTSDMNSKYPHVHGHRQVDQVAAH